MLLCINNLVGNRIMLLQSLVNYIASSYGGKEDASVMSKGLMPLRALGNAAGVDDEVRRMRPACKRVCACACGCGLLPSDLMIHDDCCFVVALALACLFLWTTGCDAALQACVRMCMWLWPAVQ